MKNLLRSLGVLGILCLGAIAIIWEAMRARAEKPVPTGPRVRNHSKARELQLEPAQLHSGQFVYVSTAHGSEAAYGVDGLGRVVDKPGSSWWVSVEMVRIDARGSQDPTRKDGIVSAEVGELFRDDARERLGLPIHR